MTETTQPRIFKVGANKIVETPAMSGLTNEQVQAQLVHSYPEVANATIRERSEGDMRIIEFLPQPGRKG